VSWNLHLVTILCCEGVFRGVEVARDTGISCVTDDLELVIVYASNDRSLDD
jgi:hypothetical protein